MRRSRTSVTPLKKLTMSPITGRYFHPDSVITKSMLSTVDIPSVSMKPIFTTESVAGTGTVLVADQNRTVLLTCAHIITMPDTVLTYYENFAPNPDPGKHARVDGIALKMRDEIYINNVSGRGDVNVLAVDPEKDLALLEKPSFASEINLVPPLTLNMGKIPRLRWGSFVYVIGFPMGTQMVTHGIVSRSWEKRGPSWEFVIDAPFNEGFSGGLVIAQRPDTNRLEWVGLARSVSAKYHYVLRPYKDMDQSSYRPNLPYEREIFVEFKRDINYGITYVVSIDGIREFFPAKPGRAPNQGFIATAGIVPLIIFVSLGEMVWSLRIHPVNFDPQNLNSWKNFTKN